MPKNEIALKEESKMEFFNEAVRVLETLVKALNGDFAPDWKSCHKRSFSTPALSMGGSYAVDAGIALSICCL